LNDVTGNAITYPEQKMLITEIVEGLYYVHEAGILWGDCKPENVLICQDPDNPTSFRARLSDFGLAVFGPSEVARFRGSSKPWIAAEAEKVVGMTALRQAEIYALGLVI
jgi:serine/threonine protein kinase